MSSVKRLHFMDIIKRQYLFKLKAYHNIIGSLFIFHIVALLLSFIGQSSTIFIERVSITEHIHSSDIIISFSLLWIFIASIYVTNRASKQMMFHFITNKWTNHLSNGLFMIILSVFGTITSVFLGLAYRLVVVLYYGIDQIFTYDSLSVTQVLITLFVAFLYHLLVFSFGYVVGEIIQLHRSFVFLVPMLLFGILILVTNVFNDPYMFTFYIKESSLLLFSFKVFGSIFLFWLIAIFAGSRLEVYQS